MPRCSQLTVKGEPCKCWATAGTDRCSRHLGLHLGLQWDRLSPEVEASLVSMLRVGNYVQVAANAAGISRQTFARWMARGREEPTGRFAQFREAVLKAQAEGQVRHVALIAQAAATDWRAAAWLLERQYPIQWGGISKRLRLEEAPEESEPVVEEADPFAEVDELAERRRGRG